MKTASETSSVKMTSAPAPAAPPPKPPPAPPKPPPAPNPPADAAPPAPPDECVADGLSLASRNRACEPPWAQSTRRGTGKRCRASASASRRGAASKMREGGVLGRVLVAGAPPGRDGGLERSEDGGGSQERERERDWERERGREIFFFFPLERERESEQSCFRSSSRSSSSTEKKTRPRRDRAKKISQRTPWNTTT